MCEILCHYQAWLLTVLKMGKCVVHQVKVFVAQSVSSVAQSRPTSCDPMDCSTPASLSITNSRSLLKFMSFKLVMPSNHLILCHPLLLLPAIFPIIRVFTVSQFFTSSGQSIGASPSASVLPMNIQD